MKIYLSSQKLGDYSDKLIELVGNNKNAVVIANALDDKPIAHRLNRVKREFEMLQSIGLNPKELDLRKYFGRGSDLENVLQDV